MIQECELLNFGSESIDIIRKRKSEIIQQNVIQDPSIVDHANSINMATTSMKRGAFWLDPVDL